MIMVSSRPGSGLVEVIDRLTNYVTVNLKDCILFTTNIIVNCFCPISYKSTISSQCLKENAVST